MTPFEIEVLLHYHYSPHDYPGLDSNPAVMDAVTKFCQAGILTEWTNRTPRFYKNDAAMKAYIDTITSIPLPKQVWIIPEQEKINQP